MPLFLSTMLHELTLIVSPTTEAVPLGKTSALLVTNDQQMHINDERKIMRKVPKDYYKIMRIIPTNLQVMYKLSHQGS